MKRPQLQICLDRIPVNTSNFDEEKLRYDSDGRVPLNLRIYFNKKYKYFSTGIRLKSIEEFQQIINGKRRSRRQKNIDVRLTHYKNKAQTIIDSLPVFTFDIFENRFYKNQNVTENVAANFDLYVEAATLSISTKKLYECAKVSIQKFAPDLTFAEVTVQFLYDYEDWMRNQGNSSSTIGIYLRNLRTIYNQQGIDNSVNPFGKVSQGKYQIPKGKNVKRALTIDEISKIYRYEAEPGSSREMARDYWMFMYLCNGMNPKDMCLLKWSNINNEILSYVREKTKTTSLEKDRKIRISLKPQAKTIIKKWGVPSNFEDDFIFPHFNKEMSEERQLQIRHQLTSVINHHMKKIAKEIGINKRVTTYYARHSFATILKRSGTDIGMISELLGHSSLDVTENYLDGFEDKQIEKETDALIAGL